MIETSPGVKFISGCFTFCKAGQGPKWKAQTPASFTLDILKRTRKSTNYALFGRSLVFSCFHVFVGWRVWVKTRKKLSLNSKQLAKHKNTKPLNYGKKCIVCTHPKACIYHCLKSVTHFNWSSQYLFVSICELNKEFLLRV
jgi:hypothetical protein